jgi:protein-tyrosine sulfotransferase
MAARERADPIFVLGILPRSGTNFLWDLLLLHPSCGPARAPIREDFFLEHADLLQAYTSSVVKWWDPAWGTFADDLPDRLHEAIGEGLISFLWVDRERRLLTKSPSVRNVGKFFTFFPQARLLILIRDGRSVVQSCQATFGWDFDTAARRWATAADEILHFEDHHNHQGLRYRVVRYENLVDDLDTTLAGVLDFLELDRAAFDFAAAARLPVRGSSAYFGPGRDSVHWEPVAPDATFDPRARWRSWPPELHERFDWIAGAQLRALGYDQELPLARSARHVARHHLLDWRWETGQAARSAAFRLRVRLGTASRPLRQKLGLVRDS